MDADRLTDDTQTLVLVLGIPSAVALAVVGVWAIYARRRRR